MPPAQCEPSLEVPEARFCKPGKEVLVGRCAGVAKLVAATATTEALLHPGIAPASGELNKVETRKAHTGLKANISDNMWSLYSISAQIWQGGQSSQASPARSGRGIRHGPLAQAPNKNRDATSK